MVIDGETGKAMRKNPETGELTAFTSEEKERLAMTIIEICLFIFARYVSSISASEIERYRKRIQDNLLDKKGSDGVPEAALLPLTKVARTIANKLATG